MNTVSHGLKLKRIIPRRTRPFYFSPLRFPPFAFEKIRVYRCPSVVEFLWLRPGAAPCVWWFLSTAVAKFISAFCFCVSAFACYFSGQMNSEMHVAGHLTALGWTTFALYLIAALLSFRAAAAALVRGRSSVVSSQTADVNSKPSSETARVWVWLGVILAALGLNKELDLQTWFIELGRQAAGREHLSESRAGLHVLFFLAFVSVLVVLILLVMLRFSAVVGSFVRQLPLAAGGCALVGAYIVIRAASIDRVDLMLGFDFERIPLLWLLEAGGLLLITVQAVCQPNKLKN
jgi:hypothetical protein